MTRIADDLFDLRARLATAEGDALTRAADDLAEGPMWFGEKAPHIVEVCANWLRERAKEAGGE